MKKIAIIGGCGRIGLPLGLILASKKNITTLFDLDKTAIQQIRNYQIPFSETGLQKLLSDIEPSCLKISDSPQCLSDQDFVIFCTPSSTAPQASENVSAVLAVVSEYIGFLSAGTTLLIRSTLYAGEFELIRDSLKRKFNFSKIAYCPERISQGNSLQELTTLPQLLAATDDETLKSTEQLFLTVTQNVLVLTPQEAVMAKLITNSWRYLEFAVANYFYMMCSEQNLDFNRIRDSIQLNYPRARAFPKAGLTAGPCLERDNRFLFSQQQNAAFDLNFAADAIHNQMPGFLVLEVEKKLGSVASKKVGLLGLSFKPNSDDLRNSLTLKVKEILEAKGAEVIVHDPSEDSSVSLVEMNAVCDAFILCVPHDVYRNSQPQLKPFVDSWGFWNHS